MIEIETFVVNMIQENCYVVSDATKEAVIIDCGAFYDSDIQPITNYIKMKGLNLRHSICTHGHFDHILGCGFISSQYGLEPEIPAGDDSLYYNCSDQLKYFVGINATPNLPKIGKYLDETCKIEFGTHKFTVIPVPGHTPGGVSFYCAEERVLFSGDSLFYCSVGRTDFPGGNGALLLDKLKSNILTLPDDVKVYPGHGRTTSIGYEKANNPYIMAFH